MFGGPGVAGGYGDAPGVGVLTGADVDCATSEAALVD
jgi:hypothetical protein